MAIALRRVLSFTYRTDLLLAHAVTGIVDRDGQAMLVFADEESDLLQRRARLHRRSAAR